MTIRAFRPAESIVPQHTQATDYYTELESRYKTQALAQVPRSQGAWSAEQNRLGSWNTGVGRLTPNGIGNSYANGWAPPKFDFDPEEAEKTQS